MVGLLFWRKKAWGICDWVHLKKERRVLGREERDLEERMERIMGGVRWGMNRVSDSCGF